MWPVEKATVRGARHVPKKEFDTVFAGDVDYNIILGAVVYFRSVRNLQK